MDFDSKKYKIHLTYAAKDGLYLKKVPEIYQTEELCLAAIENNIYAFNHIKNQTHNVCLAAMNKKGVYLALVKEQSEDICLAAIRETLMAFHLIKNQTPKLCLEAVNKDVRIINFVKDLTSIALLVSDSFIDVNLNKEARIKELKEIKSRIIMVDELNKNMIEKSTDRKISRALI